MLFNKTILNVLDTEVLLCLQEAHRIFTGVKGNNTVFIDNKMATELAHAHSAVANPQLTTRMWLLPPPKVQLVKPLLHPPLNVPSPQLPCAYWVRAVGF